MKNSLIKSISIGVATMLVGASFSAVMAEETTAEFTVTANLSVPGELNTQLPGVTAYMTNGNNPLGLGGYEAVAPTEPVADNAKLTVTSSGAMTLELNIPNPVFTLQQIDGCSNATIVKAIRDNEIYSSGAEEREGRITDVTIELNDNSGVYVFEDCVEFPTLLGVDWTVPLTLEVDLSNVTIPEEKAEPTETPVTSYGYADEEEETPAPEETETPVPTETPDVSATPTVAPTVAPTTEPTVTPTVAPTTSPTQAPISFTDVKDNDWFKSAVDYVSGNELMYGTTDTEFAPNEETTRGMLVAILYRMTGSPEVRYDGSEWYAAGRTWAMENEISDGTNMPNNVTREQLVSMLWRYDGSNEVESDMLNGFIDSNKVSDYAVNAMQWALESGIISGESDTTLNPKGNATRAQMAAMIMRYKNIK